MASAAFLSLIDEFIYLVNQVNFHLPYVQKVVQPIFEEFSVVQASIKGVEEDTVEYWNLVKEFEEIVRKVKTVIVNHARRRRKTVFKRYALHNRVGRTHLASEIQKLRGKLAKLTGRVYSLRNNNAAAGESSQQEHRNQVTGEELSPHPRGKQLSDWIRSSAYYDETEDKKTIIGLKHHMELLKARLLNKKKNQLSVISVFGIQGIGKTVLAWEVYKSSDVDNHFPCKAWVCLSAVGNHDKGVILKKIGKQVMRLQEDQETTDDGHEGGLQKRLCEFLRDKKYLIVIDDVPGSKVWHDLKEAFPNGQNGSRIMLTTRKAEVACLADSEGIPHRVWVLSAGDSWELFTRKVFIAPCRQVSSTDACPSTSTTHNMKHLCIPPQLDAIGRKMVKKCKGIPLLIVGLVDLLSSRPANVSEWSSVLHGADMRVIADDAAHRWLNLSGFLDNMISTHVKQGLPYLRGLFPTDEIDIPARRFILSWAAEGLFFGQRYGEFAEEEVANDCLQQLLHFDIIQTVKLSSNGNAKT
ncbi:disease resistance protein RPP13-like [Macadamia integrifolia]|uniref:disease resistance protein RPP13-like n=1 Tax=Macadamia integrifolia TaxID=60698 RepID=UPI001C4F0F0F|nr:disease resistance protein RPP13-like [Macadamia integrifolia]